MASSGIDFPASWAVSFVEQIPMFRDQKGALGRVLGGWSVSGSYVLQSGQAYTPVQFALNYGSGGGVYDTSFDAPYVGLYETARPFAGDSKAPVSNVGILAGDLCNYDGVAGCNFDPNTMLSLNAYNQGHGAAVTSRDNVRVIANGAYADSVYQTPWGSMGRNTLRDSDTNLANFDIMKSIKVTERWSVQFHTAFLNVLNHPNFTSVDPELDDAGLTQETTGFGIPSLWSGGARTIKFGLKILF